MTHPGGSSSAVKSTGGGLAELAAARREDLAHHDTQPAGEHPTIMRDYLQALGVTRVDLVIASHNHADHIGGLPALLQAYPAPFFMENGVLTTTQAYTQMLMAVQAAGSQVLTPSVRRISMGDVALQVIPPPGIPAWDQNDNSIGLMLSYGPFRLSLTGDAEPREWSWWQTNLPTLLSSVQVHKSSHHGSAAGDTAAGLAILRPAAVVIGVGADNLYGHPTQQALALYAAQGAAVYRTDQNGTVIVEVNSTGAYTVRPALGMYEHWGLNVRKTQRSPGAQRCHAWTNARAASLITRAAQYGHRCHLCPQTDLLPIFPVAHCDRCDSPRTSAEVQNAGVLRRGNALCARGCANSLTRPPQYLSTAADQRRPLCVTEALLPAREPAR